MSWKSKSNPAWLQLNVQLSFLEREFLMFHTSDFKMSKSSSIMSPYISNFVSKDSAPKNDVPMHGTWCNTVPGAWHSSSDRPSQNGMVPWFGPSVAWNQTLSKTHNQHLFALLLPWCFMVHAVSSRHLLFGINSINHHPLGHSDCSFIPEGSKCSRKRRTAQASTWI